MGIWLESDGLICCEAILRDRDGKLLECGVQYRKPTTIEVALVRQRDEAAQACYEARAEAEKQSARADMWHGCALRKLAEILDLTDKLAEMSDRAGAAQSKLEDLRRCACGLRILPENVGAVADCRSGETLWHRAGPTATCDPVSEEVLQQARREWVNSYSIAKQIEASAQASRFEALRKLEQAVRAEDATGISGCDSCPLRKECDARAYEEHPLCPGESECLCRQRIRDALAALDRLDGKVT
jgi:hypothetical protein